MSGADTDKSTKSIPRRQLTVNQNGIAPTTRTEVQHVYETPVRAKGMPAMAGGEGNDADYGPILFTGARRGAAHTSDARCLTPHKRGWYNRSVLCTAISIYHRVLPLRR